MGKRKNKAQVIKRTVKYLFVLPDQIILRNILQKAPDGVILAICNAALNARSGQVYMPPHLIAKFRKHYRHFDVLTNRGRSLKQKRRLLIQKGGTLPIVVPLIATILGSIGSEFISRLFRNNQQLFEKSNDRCC